MMIRVRKTLRHCKISLKLLFIRANTIKREHLYISFDAGNPELCSIKQASSPCETYCADPVHRKGYPMLVFRAIVGFPDKKTALFVISTVKQKACSHENF